tara:strand:- start:71 stop:1159 length:1089 start_codon:yes stop_codon:yes gene_type:complete
MAYTTIDDPSEYFHIQTWTGTSDDSTKTITNDANAGDFKPDWLWIKGRSGNYETRDHALYDSSRGATKRLESNATDAEVSTDSNNTFNTNGFTLTANYSINGPSTTYVGWQWKANGGTTTTNDASATSVGSLDSVYQANTTAGFSIITYTGNATSGATIAHGLGKKPSMFIIKNRSLGGVNDNWRTYHGALGADKYMTLNTNDASSTGTGNFNDTEPTTTVLSLGNAAATNGDGNSMLCYAFADIQGYSKFGSYSGNGNANGTFVYTGFKPAFILTKDSGSTEQWQMKDTTRFPNNPNYYPLFPNLSNAEGSNTNSTIDFLSNGFKIRTNDGSHNTSGNEYIYMAFAEHPFVSSEGVPATAR